MDVVDLGLPGLKLVRPQVFRDSRGYFVEAYNEPRYRRNGALEGRGDDGAWLWPFDGGDALALAEPEVTARVSRLVAQLPRWTARQVAPPCFASPPQFAMFLEPWKHGDLDTQSYEGHFADAASLVTAIRARASSLPAPHSIAYRLAPGLLTLSGHLAFVDHLA